MTQTGAGVSRLDGQGLHVNGEFRPLISGEFEYWRHHNVYWRKILGIMKDAGLEFVATFVCWDFHELSPGDFDFTGRTHPSRDLAGFIDACRDLGLQVFIRVGPIIDAEWPTRGPAPDVGILERLHPHYQQRTRQYLEALAPVLVPRLITNGGPVVLVCVDNEAYFPYSTNVDTDPSEGSIQVPYDEELVTELYRRWLRRRYASAEDLAAAWERPGLHFDAAVEPDYRRANLAETLDSFQFISDSIKVSFERLRDMCREVGIDVPLYTNMKQFTHYIDWHEIDGILDSQSLVFHQDPGWSLEQKLVAGWYCRVQRSRVRLPWAPEHGIRAPRFATLFGAALGLRGLCYYMFVERDDAKYAPISPIGKVRAHLPEFEEAIRVIKQLRPDLHLAEIGLLWSIDHHRCSVATRFPNWRRLYDMWIDFENPKELPAWWEAYRQLQEADVDFDVVALADNDLDRYRVLVYAGPEFLRRAEMERLSRWVEQGGTLICTADRPDRIVDGKDPSDPALTGMQKAMERALRPWGRLTDTLDRVGARSTICAKIPGLWTFAYEDELGWSLFLVNVSDYAQPASVTVGSPVLPEALGRKVTDLRSGAEWTLEGEGIWPEPPLLTPNEVRCLRIQRS